MLKSPTVAWVAPFAAFILALVLSPALHVPFYADLGVRLIVPVAVLLLVSRKLLDFRCASPVLSVLVGVGVFVVWVAPDLLWPGGRGHWPLQNPVTGSLQAGFPVPYRSDALALFLRITRAVVLVPVVEELFWRGWLMRWITRPDFESLPLGHYSHVAFWLTAVLFGLEHGAYWDVGVLAGAVYNGWMVRTKRLGDVILAHAVTNACLAAFVLTTGRWEFW